MGDQNIMNEMIINGKEAESIVKNHVLGSMGVGLIPVPMIDMVALTGIQVNMLRRLAKAYNVPFSKDKGKNILSSLIGGVIPIPIGGTLFSFAKTIPLVGLGISALAMPATAGAITYAVGKVFTQHFASGGTFLNFDPDEVKDYFAEMFKEGEKMATGLKEAEQESEE